MTIKHPLLGQYLFTLFAAVFCLALSFRPIPQIDNANDTVRYVQDLHLYCAGSIENILLDKEISYVLFYIVNSPACLFKVDGIFLFEVAAFLPLMFLLFAKWKNGTALWAGSLMLSVYGLELMTNAMRQSFAMFIFFAAIALLPRSRIMALSLVIIAGLAHTSVLAFLPLLMWMAGARISRKLLVVGGVILLMLGLLALFVLRAQTLELFQSTEELRRVYSLMYADELKVPFVLFIIMPLYWVYGIRYFRERKNITSDERKGAVYSTGLLVISILWTPYITYRFAIFAVALQIFLATRSESPGSVSGGYVLLGLLAHLVFMLVVSNHFEVLFYG